MPVRWSTRCRRRCPDPFSVKREIGPGVVYSVSPSPGSTFVLYRIYLCRVNVICGEIQLQLMFDVPLDPASIAGAYRKLKRGGATCWLLIDAVTLISYCTRFQSM